MSSSGKIEEAEGTPTSRFGVPYEAGVAKVLVEIINNSAKRPAPDKVTISKSDCQDRRGRLHINDLPSSLAKKTARTYETLRSYQIKQKRYFDAKRKKYAARRAQYVDAASKRLLPNGTSARRVIIGNAPHLLTRRVEYKPKDVSVTLLRNRATEWVRGVLAVRRPDLLGMPYVGSDAFGVLTQQDIEAMAKAIREGIEELESDGSLIDRREVWGLSTVSK